MALDQGILPYVFLIIAILSYVVADLVYADLSRGFKVAFIWPILLITFIGMYLDRVP